MTNMAKNKKSKKPRKLKRKNKPARNASRVKKIKKRLKAAVRNNSRTNYMWHSDAGRPKKRRIVKIVKKDLKKTGKKKTVVKKVKKISIKIKPVLKRKKAVKSKKHKKISKIRRIINTPLNFGKISPSRERILVLIISIIFVATGMIFANVFNIKNEQPEQISTVHFSAKKNAKLEKEIKDMVQGYPIEKMTPYIADKNPKTAAFLVAIAKKESNWGKQKPVLDGKDCYNYWGFRLKTDEMGSGGNSCFDSPKEAVDIVATRIDELVNEEKIDSPKEMVVWKCGSDCEAAGGQEAANKWISDVGYYYNKFSDYL
jgi:hypothetical protein